MPNLPLDVSGARPAGEDLCGDRMDLSARTTRRRTKQLERRFRRQIKPLDQYALRLLDHAARGERRPQVRVLNLKLRHSLLQKDRLLRLVHDRRGLRGSRPAATVPPQPSLAT